MVGECFNEVKVRHSGNAMGEVIEGAFTVLEQAPEVAEQVERFRAITLSDQERLLLANAALGLRYPDSTEDAPAPVTPQAILKTRRNGDRTTDLWAAFNVLQENTMKGGLVGISRDAEGRISRRRTRAVEGIDQSKRLNRELWTLTEKMAELKGA